MSGERAAEEKREEERGAGGNGEEKKTKDERQTNRERERGGGWETETPQQKKKEQIRAHAIKNAFLLAVGRQRAMTKVKNKKKRRKSRSPAAAKRAASKAAEAKALTSRTAKAPAWWRVLVLYPNLIGYVRFALLAGSLVAHGRGDPFVCALLWFISVALDAVDGWLARAFGHSSSFGALLDVVLDNASRSAMWILAISADAQGRYGSSGNSGSSTSASASSWRSVLPAAALVCVTAEWVTFLAAHTESFAVTRHWKAVGESKAGRASSLRKGQTQGGEGGLALGE